MPATMTPAAALTAYLNSIPQYLQSPLWPQLLAAAGQVRGATDAAIILQLMGAAASYGMNVPTSVQFPRDHELHLDSGAEWYWLSCNLEVEGSNGLDRVAVLAAITRSRAVSLSVQQQAGWSDVECQVVDSVDCGQHRYELRQLAAQQRFATGQAQLVYALGREQPS